MADTRKKASMSQVLADIKPYITKKFMAAPCIKEQDIQAICQSLNELHILVFGQEDLTDSLYVLLLNTRCRHELFRYVRLYICEYL